MISKVYVVYDSKAECYLDPLFFSARGQALRAFADACKDPRSNFSKHPGDYTLFEMGLFDQVKGELTQYDAKVNLGTALELMPKEVSN